MKKQLILGLGLALASSGALAQEELGFDDWDTDASGAIEEQEWNAGLEENGVFGGWDANDDDILDENEWNETGLGVGFGDWETDGEAGLTEDEFGTGLYQEYDADGDGAWSEEEWGEAEELGWFDW